MLGKRDQPDAERLERCGAFEHDTPYGIRRESRFPDQRAGGLFCFRMTHEHRHHSPVFHESQRYSDQLIPDREPDRVISRLFISQLQHGVKKPPGGPLFRKRPGCHAFRIRPHEVERIVEHLYLRHDRSPGTERPLVNTIPDIRMASAERPGV